MPNSSSTLELGGGGDSRKTAKTNGSAWGDWWK